MWEVVYLRNYGRSVEWRTVLKRCGTRAEAVSFAKDYVAKNPFGYPANEIYIMNSDPPHERLRLLDLLYEPPGEEGADFSG